MRTAYHSITTLLISTCGLACGSVGDDESDTSSGPLGAASSTSSSDDMTSTSGDSTGSGGGSPADQSSTTESTAAQPGGASSDQTTTSSDEGDSSDGDTSDDDMQGGMSADDEQSSSRVDDEGSDAMSGDSDDANMSSDEQNTNSDDSESQPVETCTDTPPDDRESCETWAQWGECGAEWLSGFCELSCGVCEPGAPSSGGGDNGGENSPDGDNSSGSDNAGGALGNDNPYPPINGGMQGNSTRYWDCCKQSCGWSANASNPVSSCDFNGNNIGVSDQSRNVCDGGGGSATTCHGMAPWAHSTELSFGYAAANGAGCGTCWQLQFTGSSGSAPGDAGSAAIAGKTMVVMATNIGDLNGALHFDLLIPGGGVGQFNGCTASLGISEGELGATRGGFLSAPECAGGDHNARKECVRNKCTSVFGSRGLTDLEAGCLWFVDWFQVADNPDFLVQQVDCPSELRQFN